MGVNSGEKLTQKTRLLARKSSTTFEEMLKSSASGETSFCGERFIYKTCVAHSWEAYELNNRKLF